MHVSSLRTRVRKQIAALRQKVRDAKTEHLPDLIEFCRQYRLNEPFYVIELLLRYLIVPGLLSALVIDLTASLMASAGLMPYVTTPLYYLPLTLMMMVLIQVASCSRHGRGRNWFNATLAFTNTWIACLAIISALLFWSGIAVSTETAANVWMLAQALMIGTTLIQSTIELFLDSTRRTTHGQAEPALSPAVLKPH